MNRIVLCLLIGLWCAPGFAAEDALKESFKKTEKGMGNLLRGMGQELKKAGGKLSDAAKKRETKKDAAKSKEEAR